MRQFANRCRPGFGLSLCLLLAACSAAPDPAAAPGQPPAATASIIERGLVDCFPAGLAKDDGKAVYCEASAVVRSGAELILASDKAIPGPGRSSVFAMDGGRNGVVQDSLRYLTHGDLLAARKFEAMTATPDGATILISTAFDRAEPGFTGGDAYNMLLAWPAGRDDDVEIVAKSTRDGVASSLPVRERLARALASEAFPDGAPYFKVEGLAALPRGRLLFGIREVGQSYKDFDYTMSIVSASYEAGETGVSLADDFALVYQFDTSRVEALGGKEVGLSSLEYDPFHDRLYLLTSYELKKNGKELMGFLWTLPLEDLDAGRPPRLVLKDDGRPLVFAHKSEGLAVVDSNHIFVVHDDDRVLGCEDMTDPETQFCRKPHQAAYTIVRLDIAGP